MGRIAKPFVGRTAEMAALANAAAQAWSGHPGIVSVDGAAGIGKTSLVRAFLTSAAAEVVLTASGDDAESTLPWGVLAQLGSGRPAEGAEGAEGAAGAAPLRQLAKLTPEADPLMAGRLLLDALGILALRTLTVIVVEDVHWIDHLSAVALRFALRRLSEERVLVVLTTRPEGMMYSDDGWRRLLDDRGDRIRLAGLQPAEVAQLVSALGGITLSPLAAARLWRHASGNPFYIRCLTDELDPEVLAAPSGPLPAPRSLATLLVARLAGCAPGTRDLVCAAAVLGERCSLTAAAAVAGAHAPADALAEALAAGLLDERHDGSGREIQFAHPLVRTAIYADLSPPRRTALHLEAARLTAGAVALSHRVAAATGPDAALAAELAELAAAESAAGLHASAARHLVSAADLSTDPGRREDRLLTATTWWLRSGAVHEVSSRRALLDTLAPSPRRDHLRGFLAQLEGRWDEAREALRAALRQLQPAGGQDLLASEVAARLAGLAVFEWDTPAALALVQAGPGTGARLPLLIRCIALTMAGRSAEARNMLGDAYPGAAPDRNSTLECLSRGFVEAWSDDLTAAKRDLETIVGRPESFGGSLRSAAQWLLADVYYRLGAFDDALVTAELARSALQDTGRAKSPEIAMAWAVAAYTASARGDWTEARGYIAAVQDQATPAASKFERACAAAARWSLAVARDDPQVMLDAACSFEADGDAPELALFPVGPAMPEALWRNGKLNEAADSLVAYEARARQLGRVSAVVGAGRVRGLLEAGRHDEVAALRAFEETAPLAVALPQPLEAARFMTAHGTVLARLGRRTAAADRITQARQILGRIGARPYLQRADRQLERLGGEVRHRSRPGELTASESVVARLVASGLSNKQAAERLTVSVKAVEYHLANIYAKLGVSSRSQLAARHDLAGAGPSGAADP